MLINDFLYFRLGVQFEEKYNELAVKEVLSNKDKYSLIYDIVENMVDYDEEGNIINIDFDSGFFDCDDIELCADIEETLELYNAFIKSFWKENKNEKFKLDLFSLGYDYLKALDMSLILDPYLNYNGMEFLSIYPNKRVFGKLIMYPNIIGTETYGIRNKKEECATFYLDSKDLLSEMSNSLYELLNCDNIITDYFDIIEIKKGELCKNMMGYPYYSLDFKIGDNYIKMYFTNKGYDKLRKLCISQILNALSDNEKEMNLFFKV